MRRVSASVEHPHPTLPLKGEGFLGLIEYELNP